MASYEKTAFTAADLFTAVTTNGTAVYGASGLTLTFTSGGTATDVLGIFLTAKRDATKGDFIYLKFVPLTIAGLDYYFIPYIRNQAVPALAYVSGSGAIGDYIYPDGGGEKHHGNAFATTNNTPASATLVEVDVEYTTRWSFNPSTGFLTGEVKGGAIASYVTLGTSDSDFAGLPINVQAQCFGTGPTAATRLTWYAYTDSNGPTPAAPTTPTASATGETTIDAGWTTVDIAAFQTGTKVERSLTGGGAGFAVVATIAFGTSTFGDTGRTAGTTYYYRMRAYFTLDGVDYYSAYTSEASATTSTASGGGDGGSSSNFLLLGDI